MSLIDYIIIDPVNNTTYFNESQIPLIVLGDPSIRLIRQCKNPKYVFVPGRGCIKRCFIKDIYKNKNSAILNEVTIRSSGRGLLNTYKKKTTISLIGYSPEFKHGSSFFSTLPLSDELHNIIRDKFKDVKISPNGRYRLPPNPIGVSKPHEIFFSVVSRLAALNDPVDLGELIDYTRSTRLLVSYSAFKVFASQMADLGLSDDAKRAWDNYLSASGKELQIDLKKLYDEDDLFKQDLEDLKDIYIKAIKILHSSNPNIATSVSGSENNKFFTLYAKQLYNISTASGLNSKIIIGAHSIRTRCLVNWNSDTETYSCTLYVETEDLWDANNNGMQTFPIPVDTITILGIPFDLRGRVPSIVNLMDWSRDIDTGEGAEPGDVKNSLITNKGGKGNRLDVQDETFGIFETFGLAKPFIVKGSFSIEFTFQGSNSYEKSECCPIPSEYSSYNDETEECECGFSDENEIYKKYKLITNYIYADPEQVTVSAVLEPYFKYFPNENDKKERVPIIAYCDCPGDLALNFVDATPQQLIDNPDKSFYLYCECPPSGMIPDPENDTKCVCDDQHQFTKALCEDAGYHDYSQGKIVSSADKYNIFLDGFESTFFPFPFDYTELKKGCECICYEDYTYDSMVEKCLCSKKVKHLSNIDPTAIEHINFNKKATSYLGLYNEYTLTTLDGKCACPEDTISAMTAWPRVTIVDCQCIKANTIWSQYEGKCICLEGLSKDSVTGECVCPEGKIYDYLRLKCVSVEPSSSSSSDSSSSSEDETSPSVSSSSAEHSISSSF